ncbi:MAG: tetratricopeptide repeat protein [Actinomycetota bacterium]
MSGGSAYEWYQRGLELLRSGDHHEAATLFEKAAEAESGKSSIHEALARAYFGSGRFGAALREFTTVIDISPTNDYAYFGSGLCLGRLGRIREAVGQLRMANVMRPGNADYEAALARWEGHAASILGDEDASSS